MSHIPIRSPEKSKFALPSPRRIVHTTTIKEYLEDVKDFLELESQIRYNRQEIKRKKENLEAISHTAAEIVIELAKCECIRNNEQTEEDFEKQKAKHRAIISKTTEKIGEIAKSIGSIQQSIANYEKRIALMSQTKSSYRIVIPRTPPLRYHFASQEPFYIPLGSKSAR